MTTHEEVLRIINKARNEAQTFKQGAQQVHEKIEGEHIRPLPPQGVNPGRGISSVLPGMHQTAFGSSAIEFRGSVLAHGQRKGSAVEFGHGCAADVTLLRGFAAKGHNLQGKMPNFTQSVLKGKKKK
jgi:hypothetical protein